MQGSKEWLEDNDFYPTIKWKEDPRKHEITLVRDELAERTFEGQPTKAGVRFIVKEDGETKEFFTTSRALIKQLSEFTEGSKVAIELVEDEETGKSTFVVELLKAGEELSDEALQEIFGTKDNTVDIPWEDNSEDVEEEKEVKK